jgi:hypothetical protein
MQGALAVIHLSGAAQLARPLLDQRPRVHLEATSTIKHVNMKHRLNFLSLLTGSIILLGTGLWTGCMTNASSDRTAEQNREDGTITARVKTALATDPQYKYDGVIVSTFHSSVQLSGFVDSEAQKDRAGEITEKIAGVKRVDNKISLKKPAL